MNFAFAQVHYAKDSVVKIIDTPKTINEIDVVDLYHKITSNYQHHRFFKPQKKTERVHLAFIPAFGYTLQTGFASLLSGNMVFFTDESSKSKVSNVIASIAYTQNNQIIFPLHADIWTKRNKWNIIVDYRYMKYPSATFGLGSKSLDKDEDDIDFSYLRLHQSALRKVTADFYVGGGYFYDYLWNEHEINPPQNTITSFQRYGTHSSETASGLNLQLLYDNRENQVNPLKGFYASLNLRNNLIWMGSDSHWQSGILEIKKYFTFPAHSKNVLAFWNYDWFTTGRKTPYLLLPSTGWDDFFNTGRGYIQGRFRGKNMSYLETEYRFRILKNGLLGGVVFGNAQSFSRDISSSYKSIAFGYGLGLRIKLNKHSATNLCIDYGFGESGSRGFFVNLGEVF